MIDHVKVGVSDVQKAKEYYAKALAPLGYSIHFEAPGMAYFADTAGLDFGVGAPDSPGSTHVGFTVADADAVRAFYDAALAAGGDGQRRARASSRVRRRATTRRTFSIRTATTSRRSATRCRSLAT